MALRKRCHPLKLVYARQMRKNPTPAEAALWVPLRALKASHGVKWRRQAVILGYIVDFFCPRLRLVIEVDGSAHDGREVYDAERTRALEHRAGLRVLRFRNEEVLADPESVALSSLPASRVVSN